MPDAPRYLSPDALRAMAAGCRVTSAIGGNAERRAEAKRQAEWATALADAGCGVMLLPVTAQEPVAPWLDGGADKQGPMRQMRRWTEILDSFGKEGTADGSPR